MKKSTKFIRLSVVILLLFAMLLTPMSPIFAVVIDSMGGDTDLTAADIVSEDASKREQFSRHYLTGDGTYFAVSYAEAVNYQDEDGNWIPVDNSLSTNILTGEKSTRNEKFKVKFANKANKDDLVSIQTEDYKVSFGITVSEDGENYLSLSKVKGTESARNTSAEPKTTQEATSLGKAVSGITYKNAFSDYLDVRYSVAHEKVKEDIILQKKSYFKSYKSTYNIKEKDALATLNEDGSITFTSPDGAILFTVGAPVMYDSDGKSSADIAVSMVQTKKTVEITYTPNAEWLSAEDRVYPVIIDPETSTSEYDSNITDLCFYALDLSNVSSSAMYLSVGMDYYDYIQFDYIPTLSEDDTLSGASLVLQGNYLNDWGSTAPCSATLAAPTVAWDENSFGYGEGQYDYDEIPVSSRYTLNNLTFEYNDDEDNPHYLLELSLHGFFTSVSEYTTFFNSTYGFEVIMCYDYEFRAYASEHPNDGYHPAIVVRYDEGEWVIPDPDDEEDDYEIPDGGDNGGGENQGGNNGVEEGGNNGNENEGGGDNSGGGNEGGSEGGNNGTENPITPPITADPINGDPAYIYCSDEYRLYNRQNTNYVTYTSNGILTTPYSQQNANQKVMFGYTIFHDSFWIALNDGTQYRYYCIDEDGEIYYDVYRVVNTPDTSEYETWNIYNVNGDFVIANAHDERYVLTDVGGEVCVAPYDNENQGQKWKTEFYKSIIIDNTTTDLTLSVNESIYLKISENVLSYETRYSSCTGVVSGYAGVITANKTGYAELELVTFSTTYIVNIIVPLDDGTYYVSNADGNINANFLTNSFLDNVCQMHLTQFDESNNQLWNIEHVGDGYHSIINVATGDTLTSSGTWNFFEDSYSGANNQLWKITQTNTGYIFKTKAYEIDDAKKSEEENWHYNRVLGKNANGELDIVGYVENDNFVDEWQLLTIGKSSKMESEDQPDNGCWATAARIFAKHYYPDDNTPAYKRILDTVTISDAIDYVNEQDSSKSNMPESIVIAVNYYVHASITNETLFNDSNTCIAYKVLSKPNLQNVLDNGDAVIIGFMYYTGDAEALNNNGHIIVVSGYVYCNDQIYFIVKEPDGGLTKLVLYDDLLLYYDGYCDWEFTILLNENNKYSNYLIDHPNPIGG